MNLGLTCYEYVTVCTLCISLKFKGNDGECDQFTVLQFGACCSDNMAVSGYCRV